MKGLEDIVGHLVRDGIAGELWVNGTFLTKKIDPRDVHVLLILSSAFVDNATLAQRNCLAWFGSNLKASHLCDTYIHTEFPANDPRYWEGDFMRAYWTKQFGFSRSELFKGIALVSL